MQILYLSGMASPAALVDAKRRNPQFSGYAAQKFNRLVVEGLVRNGHSVTALSSFYLPGVGHGYYRKSEEDKGVQYQYITAPNNHLLRHLWLCIYCFCRVFCFGLFRKNEKVLIANVLNISACMGAVAAARLVGLKRVGIMTDMPGLMVGRGKTKVSTTTKQRASFNTRMNKSFLGHFTHYVFLTEQMNEAVNVNHCPYIVMEGLVDADTEIPKSNTKKDKRVVLYAGGLHERYGLRMLVDGFLQANIDNSELWLYGNGPFAEELPDYHRRAPRVVYHGIKPNDEVVAAELQATLLVNPRPTQEEFTKYSFPSKNMEYMASGTPLLTTQLPGMPVEYYPHVFLFDCGETTDGYAEVLRKVLSLSNEELQAKGSEARQWVFTNKNNVKQTARIIELLLE